MKLVRFGEPGAERPGVWLEEGGEGGCPAILDVRAMAFDIEDYDAHFFERHGLARVAALCRETRRKVTPVEGVRLGPPLARPSKIICLGKNYAAHAKEFGAAVPDSPILFGKATTAMIGPYDPIRLPAEAVEVDGEAELAVVIGRSARHVPEADALRVVAGYTIVNDVTDRVAQRAAGQWYRGKSPDTFCPIGPWLVTADEVPDPQALALGSSINGVVMQNGTTADMVFPVVHLIAFISATITLLPGDVIATGTPAGIGTAHHPPVVFQPGDVTETWVERLGRQRNRIERDDAARRP